jgi:hypothetical protein
MELNLKHEDLYDKHADRKFAKSPKKKFKESFDPAERKRRANFKSYVRDLEEEELMGDDLDFNDDNQQAV